MDIITVKNTGTAPKVFCIMSVREMPNTQGFSIPVFEWRWESEKGIVGGELRAWILSGFLVFKSRRDTNELGFDSVEKALNEIADYGWKEPPHIREVFSDIAEAKKRFPTKTKEEVEQILSEIRRKWTALVVSLFL